MSNHKFNFIQIICLSLVGSAIANDLSSEIGFDVNATLPFEYDGRHVDKRSNRVSEDEYTYLNIGVLMASHLGAFSLCIFQHIFHFFRYFFFSFIYIHE